MSSGERILFLDNSFKMCHCLSMSVMDKKVMQNEMTIFFQRILHFSTYTYKAKLSNMKNCCSSTLKTLYHTLMTISSWNRWNRCCPFLLWPSFVRIPRNHRCQHLIVKFHKNSQSRSSAIYATLDLWLYTQFMGETWCGKEGEGVWERKKSK